MLIRILTIVSVNSFDFSHNNQSKLISDSAYEVAMSQKQIRLLILVEFMKYNLQCRCLRVAE